MITSIYAALICSLMAGFSTWLVARRLRKFIEKTDDDMETIFAILKNNYKSKGPSKLESPE